MSDQQNLSQYIAASKAQGIPEEKIKTDLLAAGWKEEVISPYFIITPVQATQPEKSTQVAQQPTQMIQSEQQVTQSAAGKKKIVSIIVGAAIGIAVLGGVTYAYTAGLIPFIGGAPYTQENLVSGIAQKIGQIDSASYAAKLNIYVEDREEDAEPFVLERSLELKTQYAKDVELAEGIEEILRSLSWDYQESYPETLSKIFDSTNSYLNVKEEFITENNIQYKKTTEGYELSFSFETQQAVDSLKNGWSSDEMQFNNKQVTLNQESYSLYLPDRLPKTYFEELSDMTQYISPEFTVTAQIAAKSTPVVEGQPWEWQARLSGEGDLGDLTYKVDLEARKKGEDYYFIINNLPSLLSGFLPEKGQWIKVSAKDDLAASSMGLIDTKELQEFGEEFKEQRAAVVDFLKIATRTADEVGVFQIINKPKKEKIGDRNLYRYELKLNGDNLVEYYDRMLAEIDSDERLGDFKELLDPEIRNQLNSPEFVKTLEYYNKNNTITVWVDSNGFPVRVANKMRIVPSDEIVNLNNKQVIFETILELNDINTPIEIELPEGAIDYEEAFGVNSDLQNMSSDASLKASLSNMRVEIELAAYDADFNATAAFPVGVCSKKEGTLFGIDSIYEEIEGMTEYTDESIMCAAGVGLRADYAISTLLASDTDYSWCVDSTGSSKEILGTIDGPKC